MRSSRRELLAAGGATFLAGLAGCASLGGSGSEEPTANPTDEPSGGDTPGSGTETPEPSGDEDGAESGGETPTASVETAVAAEWNAMRARVDDALSLGVAGEGGAGAAVAGNTFARFEQASGEYGAHEMLESTSEESYAGFEESLGELRSAGLEAGNVGRAREEATLASDHLAAAQTALAGERTAQVLDLQSMGATVQNAAILAAAEKFEAAATVAEDTMARFEAASVHDALESADAESYGAFEEAVGAVTSAAGEEDAAGVREAANEAFEAAIHGSYAVAGNDTVAGVGHIAALQARGWDAAALATMGGPATAFAHAAALTIYRARVYDCHWLAARGGTDLAATMASDVFAHFEGARAHEALEQADGEAYEGFEAGLSDLRSAIEDGDSGGIDEAVAAVDSNLVAGIGALAGSDAPVLESAFFKTRFADARELYRLGANNVAASIAEGLFERFEENELDFHESVESTSEELYTSFEEDHLSGLTDAFENTDDSGVETHYEGVQSTLLEYETTAGSVPVVSGAEGAFVAARGFDAAVLDDLGKDSRAEAIAQEAFEHFESGAGGYHEALEAADESIYGAFEGELGAIGTAARDGDAVYPVSKQFDTRAVDSVYAIVGSGGSGGGAAATVMQDVFAHFEQARIHDPLEETDHNAYSTFEGHLESYLSTLEDGGDANAAAESFAMGSQYAQFALVDSVEQLPLDLDLAAASGGGGGESGEGGESNLQGGPNVVEGVPDDADHVVDMKAVAFDPTELTVSQGDTVAWTHAAGEAHNVVAYADGIPDGAEYWASGGFDSEEAARTGWEEGTGAVQSGQSYVHTFETTGTHEYFCVPHEAAGMVGTVVVE